MSQHLLHSLLEHALGHRVAGASQFTCQLSSRCLIDVAVARNAPAKGVPELYAEKAHSTEISLGCGNTLIFKMKDNSSSATEETEITTYS